MWKKLALGVVGFSAFRGLNLVKPFKIISRNLPETKFEQVSFKTEDGIDIAGWWIPGEEPLPLLSELEYYEFNEISVPKISVETSDKICHLILKWISQHYAFKLSFHPRTIVYICRGVGTHKCGKTGTAEEFAYPGRCWDCYRYCPGYQVPEHQTTIKARRRRGLCTACYQRKLKKEATTICSGYQKPEHQAPIYSVGLCKACYLRKRRKEATTICPGYQKPEHRAAIDAGGLCGPCYLRKRRKEATTICPGYQKPEHQALIYSGGLCGPCYQRKRVKEATTICSGYQKPEHRAAIVSGGLCGTCYQRKQRKRRKEAKKEKASALRRWNPSRRTRTRYRRNSDVSLRKLERAFRESGGKAVGFRLAAEYKRIGRAQQSLEVLDSIWVPVSLDLTFLHDMEIEGWDGDWYWKGAAQTRDSYPVFVHPDQPLISATDFIEEWILAEWGSYEDHGEPTEGHVVNVLERGPKHILQINAFSEIGDLITSMGGNTAGLNYTNIDTGGPEVYIEGLVVELPELYSEMSSEVMSRLRKLERDFLSS